MVYPGSPTNLAMQPSVCSTSPADRFTRAASPTLPIWPSVKISSGRSKCRTGRVEERFAGRGLQRRRSNGRLEQRRRYWPRSLHMERMAGFQQQGLALQQQGLDLSQAYTQQQWGFQDTQRQMQYGFQQADLPHTPSKCRCRTSSASGKKVSPGSVSS